MDAEQLQVFRKTLEAKADSYGVALDSHTLDRLTKYYEQLAFWNSRLHLVAPTAPDEFATRHILESLLLLGHLPRNARIADVGSGGGLPIIPCLIARSDIQAVLIESSKKKAVFLREASKFAELNATVIAERFENVPAPDVDFVTCRALEQFEGNVKQLIEWAPLAATLLLFGGPGLKNPIEASGAAFDADLIPRSERRFLFRVRRPEGFPK